MTTSNQRGSTTYVIYGSHPKDLLEATDFQARVNSDQPDEVILLDRNSNDARSLLSFYSISDTQTPQTIMVGQDDTLLYHWSPTLPTVEDVLYRLRQLGE